MKYNSKSGGIYGICNITFFDKAAEEKIYDLIKKIIKSTGNKSFLKYGINLYISQRCGY